MRLFICMLRISRTAITHLPIYTWYTTFRNWFLNKFQLKKKVPKNRLLKHLEKNKLFINEKIKSGQANEVKLNLAIALSQSVLPKR